MRYRRERIRILLLLMTILIFTPIPAWSQQVTAALLGRVVDQNDAPVAKARVTAKDEARGTIWTTETNTDGVYNLPRLPVGSYEVRVEAQGFQTAVRPGTLLAINQAARLDIQMKVGEITQTVEISAAAPILQKDTTQLATIIDSRTNTTLPLATRNYIQLTLLSPGSVNPNPASMIGGGPSVFGGRPYINGNREQANNFLLDGVDNNQVSDNLVGFSPSPDAIQEFNLITNNASAEFGNFQGGIISVSIKSGTNQFHGSAFEFFRNDKLNANNWANNLFGSPRQKIRYNQYGGAVGGPIIKDKLFFFADYQALRNNTPASTNFITVFTAKERQGDFSELLSKRGVQLYNPFVLDASGNRVPFPNNQIPLGLINPVAKNLFSSSLYPAPINGELQGNQFNTTHSFNHVDQGDIKIDYARSQKDHIFGRYSQSQTDNPTTNSFPLLADSFLNAPTYNTVVNWTRTFSPGLVNEVRFGVNYVRVNNGGADKGLGNIAEQLGIKNGNDRASGLLALNFGANLVNNLGDSNSAGTQQLFADSVIQFENSLIITRGQHIFRTGFQYMRNRVNTFYAGNNGRTGFMAFSGRYTAGPDPLAVASGTAGAGEADFFLGLLDQLGRGVNSGTWGQRSNVIAAYFQDDWRVRNNLTLNLGLRYQTYTPWTEVMNRQVNFAPISGAIQCAGEGRADLGCSTPATIYEDNRALYNPHNWDIGNFQPRIGFAWTPESLGGKTVVRGAYTISSYLEGTGTNLRLPLNPPFTTEFDRNYFSLPLPTSRTEDGLTVLSSAADPFSGAIIRLWDPNVRPAIVQQWNLSLQRQFTNEMTLQLGYVGQRGAHLMVPMPYFQRQLLGGFNPDGSPRTAPSPYLSGNPALKNIGQISGTESNGTQSYNALQATLQKRFSSGLQYQVAYTYSKAMANSSGYYGSWGGQTIPTSPYWQNLYDGKSEWGPAFFDVTHALSAYVVYELPVGKSKKYGSNMKSVVDALAGGWQVSGIVQLHGGYPLTISGGDASGTNSRGARANCIGPSQVFGKKQAVDASGKPVPGYQWFDPNAYGPAAPGSFGTCGVATVRGPGLHTLDMGFQKRFAITESKGIQFRGEFINFTNTPILTAPNTGLGSTLGLLQGSQGPRTVQLALKFLF